MARFLMVSCVCLLVAVLHNQVAASALEAQTNLGLALPSSLPGHPVTGQDFATVAANDPSTYDEEYILDLEREEMEEVQQMLAEESMPPHAATVAKPSVAIPVSTFKRLPVPFELSAAQPVMAMASTFGEEVRNAVQQAFAVAHKMVKSPGTAKLITATSSTSPEAEPVNIVQLAQSANPDGGADIDVTVTIERPGSTWSLPNMLPNSMSGMFGQDSSSDSDSQLELAAEVAQAFIENALTREVSKLGDDQELVLDMTLENAPRQASEKLIAAAAAAAANAARSAVNKQPWDTVELQMDIVETTQPFFKSGCFFVFAMLLLTAQLALCFAVTILWTESAEVEEQEEGEDDGRIEYVEIALKPQKQQQQQQQQQGEWASMAEEGRGLYEKLLSYT